MWSEVERMVRRGDPDRYLTALFAPAELRGPLCALYAFNHELARAREVAREPLMAAIRLQWWREVVQGEARPHEVATPVSALLRSHKILRGDLLAMIAARELEAEFEIASLSDWRAWLLAGPGSLCVAAARLLGAPEAALDRARALGAAYGVAGIMRSIAVLARQGRCVLPADVLAEHGLSAWDVIGAPSSPKLAPLRAGLAAEGRMLAGQAEPCGRGWVAAALPAVLARRDLARAGQQPRPRLLGDRMAVVAAWMRGLA